MDLMLFTGLARSDAIKVGRQHVRDGVIEYRRTKTSAPIYIAILPALRASIDASPTGDMAFLTTSRGKPWGSAASFGNQFSDWCRDAGLPVRAHGLRKRIATIMAEGGGTNSQVKGLFRVVVGRDGGSLHPSSRRPSDGLDGLGGAEREQSIP